MTMKAIVHSWHMESINSLQDLPQAPSKTEILMRPAKVPSNINIPDLTTFKHCFLNAYKIITELYGIKYSFNTWLGLLLKGLLKRGWLQ